MAQCMVVAMTLAAMLATDGIVAQANDSEGSQIEKTSEVTEDTAILAGPEVREDSGPELRFDGLTRRGRGVPDIAPDIWLRVLRQIELTEEQTRQLGDIITDLRERQGQFQSEYGQELREFEQLRRQAREQGRDVIREKMPRFREIMQKQPSVIDTQKEIWAILTPEQQDQMTALLNEVREEQRMRRMQQATDRVMDQNDMKMSEGKETAEPSASRGRAGHLEAPGLDRAGLRRLRFLRRFQQERPAGAPPSTEDRKIDFDDDD